MARNSRANGLTTKCTAADIYGGPMARNTLDSSMKIRGMARANLDGRTAESMKASGVAASNMESALTETAREKNAKASG
jgi:hypothetical protein